MIEQLVRFLLQLRTGISLTTMMWRRERSLKMRLSTVRLEKRRRNLMLNPVKSRWQEIEMFDLIIKIRYLTKFSVLFDFHHVCSSWTVLESLWCGICDSKIWNIGTLMFLYGCFMRAHQPFLSMHHMLSNYVNIKAISSSQSRLLFLFSLFFCWLCLIGPTYIHASFAHQLKHYCCTWFCRILNNYRYYYWLNNFNSFMMKVI